MKTHAHVLKHVKTHVLKHVKAHVVKHVKACVLKHVKLDETELLRLTLHHHYIVLLLYPLSNQFQILNHLLLSFYMESSSILA